jgi:hypothetical protein
MGNTWDFTLWAPCEDPRALVRHLLEAARRAGYTPLDADRPAATVLTDQLVEVEVDSLDELVDLVAREGGSLPLWRPAGRAQERPGEGARHRDDARPSPGARLAEHRGSGEHSGARTDEHTGARTDERRVRREPEHDDDRGEDLLASFRPERHRASLGCLHDLRADRPADRAKAADLTRLFRLAVASPLVGYGHCSDEHLLEALWQGQDFGAAHHALWAAIAARRPPPVLFWQTYLRADLFAALPAAALAAVPHRAETTPHGTLLVLAEHPWQATLAVLDSSTGAYRLTR